MWVFMEMQLVLFTISAVNSSKNFMRSIYPCRIISYLAVDSTRMLPTFLLQPQKVLGNMATATQITRVSVLISLSTNSYLFTRNGVVVLKAESQLNLLYQTYSFLGVVSCFTLINWCVVQGFCASLKITAVSICNSLLDFLQDWYWYGRRQGNGSRASGAEKTCGTVR